MVAGEPGIGKTRTAQELATYAGMRGAQVLWGRSYESGGAPAYWPWVQAIRSHVASTESDVLRNQMGSTASVIAEVVADVRDMPVGPVGGVSLVGHRHLAEIVLGDVDPGRIPRLADYLQQQPHEQRDDRDDHQKLDDRKAAGAAWTASAASRPCVIH